MVDPISAIAAGGSLISGIGGLLAGSGAARDAKRFARNALEIQGTAFSPITVGGPGGAGISFGGSPNFLGGSPVQPGGAGGVGFQPGGGTVAGGTPNFLPGGGTPNTITDLGGGFRQVGRGGFQSDIGNINLTAGNLDPVQAAIAGAAGGIDLGQGSLNPAQLLGLGLGGAGAGAFDPAALQQLGNFAGSAANTNFALFGDAVNNPFLGGAETALGQQGADILGGVGDFQSAFDTTLGRLREAAQPFEDRAFNQLQQRQFSTGQRGTTGGALQTEAFARGLGQADLQRQIQAGGEARAQTAADLATGQGLLGAGSGLRALQDQLTGTAFNRFGDAANLSSGITGNIANLALGQQQFGSNLFNLGTQAQLFPQEFQAGNIANVANLINASGGIQNQALNPANLALNFMNAQAGFRTGQGANMINSIGNLTGPQTFRASALGDLSQALGGGDAIGSLFRNVFGGGGGGNTIGADQLAAINAGVS